MNRRCIIVVTMLLLCGVAYPAPAPPPAQDEIVKTFESGDYPLVLQQLARVLPLRGKAAANYDRFELLMLKGETHLRQKQFKTAGDAFGAAAKETRDDVRAATARATQRLVREAKGPEIKRRIAKKDEPLQKADLLDKEERVDALRILYEDLSAMAEPKVKEAARARTLPPIADALTLLLELHDFELAGAGSNETSDKHDKARDDLGHRAQELVARELDRMETDVASIDESANQVVSERVRSSVGSRSGGAMRLGNSSGGSVGTGTTTDSTTIDTIYRGLSRQDQRDLNSIITTCDRIMTTVDDLTRVNAGDDQDGDKLSERAKTVRNDARRVLNAPYRTSAGVRDYLR